MTALASSSELASWLRLALAPGIGPVAGRALLGRFGLPENIFTADAASLRALIPARLVPGLLAPVSAETQALIERTIDWARQPGNHLLTLADEAYPSRLLDTADPPLLLYAKGRIALLQAPSLAVVGSRNATAQGIADAGRFARSASEAGLTIVSGLAMGIDAAAHRGGLGGPGSTVAVIGTGIDIVYPARNHALAHEIAAMGCLVSEYPLGTPAVAANFPRRNRIISGLSRGVLVVEAASRSGSLITARLAADQGRDVFAIPGSIHSPLSKGCHELIKQGAKLVDTAQDILDELGASGGWNESGWRAEAPAAAVSNADAKAHAAAASDARLAGEDAAESGQRQLLEALGFGPTDFDTLALRCALPAAELSARLLEMELAGQIEVLPGGAYQRFI